MKHSQGLKVETFKKMPNSNKVLSSEKKTLISCLVLKHLIRWEVLELLIKCKVLNRLIRCIIFETSNSVRSSATSYIVQFLKHLMQWQSSETSDNFAKF
jgi:hypothetical protein